MSEGQGPLDSRNEARAQRNPGTIWAVASLIGVLGAWMMPRDMMFAALFGSFFAAVRGIRKSKKRARSAAFSSFALGVASVVLFAASALDLASGGAAFRPDYAAAAWASEGSPAPSPTPSPTPTAEPVRPYWSYEQTMLYLEYNMSYTKSSYGTLPCIAFSSYNNRNAPAHLSPRAYKDFFGCPGELL